MLMSFSGGSVEDQNAAERQIIKTVLTRFQRVKHVSSVNETADHLCCVLAKNLVIYCLCPGNWSKVVHKNKKLILLKEEF